MTNDLFRDYLDNRIPGHETPTTVWVTITPQIDKWLEPEPDPLNDWAERTRTAINRAYENLRMAAMGGLRTTFFTGEWTDYGAQRGLEGLERAHFNEAVEKMTRTTLWTRDECAEVLGKIMDAAQRVELEALRPERHPNSHCAPADPRARALWAKQSRGNGPTPDNLTKRGRITRYKEKR